MPKVKKEEKLIVSTFARPESLKDSVDERLLIENKELRAKGEGNLSLTGLVCTLLAYWLDDVGLRSEIKARRRRGL